MEELERQSAAIAVRIAEKQRLAREDRENRSTSNGAKVLVHNSPSPSASLPIPGQTWKLTETGAEKKRTREDEVYHRASRPHAPSFHDSTQAGPPVFSHADSFTARSNKIASSSRAFASHESALPRQSRRATGNALRSLTPSLSRRRVESAQRPRGHGKETQT